MSFGSVVIRDPRETVTVRDDQVTVVTVATQGPQGPTPVTPGSVIAAPGDLIVGDALGDPTTLAIGAEHEVLSVESGVLTWVPAIDAWFNVRDYGAIGDGVADDTAEIQAAIDAAEVAGGTVFFPAGTYKVTTPGLTVLAWSVCLVGVGDASRIAMASATADTLTIGSTSTFVAFNRVSDLRFEPSVTRNAGTFEVKAVWFAYLVCSRLRIEGAHSGFSFGNTNAAKGSAVYHVEQTWVIDFDLAYYLVNAIAPFFRDNRTDAQRLAANTFVIDGGVEGGSFIGGDHVNSETPDNSKTGTCLIMRASDYTTVGPRWLKFVACHFDQHRQGLDASSGTDIDFDGCWFSCRPWAGAAVGAGAKRFRFRGCDASNNGTFGFLIDGGDQHRVVDCAAMSNNEQNGGGDGVRVSAGTTGVHVRGCICANDSATTPFTAFQEYGIRVSAGATEYTLVDNDTRGNVTGGLSHPSGTGFIVANNR